MNKNFKRITKLLLITGCVSVIANYAGNAAPLSYDLNQNAPAVRTNYTTPNKIRLEGDVHFDDHGQLINLSLRNTDVQQVLRMFADKAGLNIVFHSSANGTITMDLVDVTLEDAFKMVMKMCNLTYVIKDKTMMVVGISEAENLNLTKDNISILPVKYADAAYIAQFLNTNIFSLNSPGLSYGPIVTTNAEKNELLIFGTENDYQMAKKIVDKFDRKPVMTTYRVNHTTPGEMGKMICETLFQLPSEGSQSKSTKGGAGSYNSQLNASMKMQNIARKENDTTLGGGSIACTVKSGVSTSNISSYQGKPTITIYVQEDLGTLTMVGGSEQQIQMVNDFILENDRKQPQAYMEISIIALTENGSRDFNNSWNYQGKHINISSDSGETSIGPITWHGPKGSPQVRSLTQTISYLIKNEKARLLANPKLVLTNGKKSVIDLTSDYIETTTVQVLNSGGSGAYNNNAVQKTYEIGEDNGIKIEITPFISPDGYVSLTMKPQYASPFQYITEYYPVNGQTIPYTAATLLQRHNLELTNVRIKDEETLLLGGMITENETNSTGKIPILGDIPIIGFFFRSQHKAMKKEELLIMMTPRIIKDTEDIVEL